MNRFNPVFPVQKTCILRRQDSSFNMRMLFLKGLICILLIDIKWFSNEAINLVHLKFFSGKEALGVGPSEFDCTIIKEINPLR
jgi:hypothetical protein